jgi:hypothetical protein
MNAQASLIVLRFLGWILPVIRGLRTPQMISRRPGIFIRRRQKSGCVS